MRSKESLVNSRVIRKVSALPKQGLLQIVINVKGGDDKFERAEIAVKSVGQPHLSSQQLFFIAVVKDEELRTRKMYKPLIVELAFVFDEIVQKFGNVR